LLHSSLTLKKIERFVKVEGGGGQWIRQDQRSNTAHLDQEMSFRKELGSTERIASLELNAAI